MEVTTNQNLADVILMCSFGCNQRDFRLDDVKRTLRNIYHLDTFLLYSTRGKFVVGGGVALRACAR